ncbi:MAG: hypothetical protein AABX38_07320 [Candidatus Micrarchaeota archaeon]
MIRKLNHPAQISNAQSTQLRDIRRDINREIYSPVLDGIVLRKADLGRNIFEYQQEENKIRSEMHLSRFELKRKDMDPQVITFERGLGAAILTSSVGVTAYSYFVNLVQNFWDIEHNLALQAGGLGVLMGVGIMLFANRRKSITSGLHEMSNGIRKTRKKAAEALEDIGYLDQAKTEIVDRE